MQEKIWKIQASYTVEASYIMSMVILSLAVLIRAAYGQYLDKTSLFLMNYAVERLYGQEENKSEALQYGSVSGNAVRTKTQVTGTICGQDHMRSIQKRVHEPEEVLSGSGWISPPWTFCVPVWPAPGVTSKGIQP